MLGAIIGDTIGSIYDFNNVTTTDFPLFSKGSSPTNNSVMSIAVAEWLLTYPERTPRLLDSMSKWWNKYSRTRYGGTFPNWLLSPQYLYGYRDDTNTSEDEPYGRWGSGSATRASACGWVAQSIEEALDLGKRSAEITHNHPEGIKGAQCVAAAIFLARTGASKEEIRTYILDTFGYDLSRDCDDIRPDYSFDVSCQGTMPAALAAFFDSKDYESAVRLAVSLGGDSDTIACITGGITEAFYGEIPEAIVTEARQHIPEEFWPIIKGIKGSE